ncbi:hypothetical protein D3C81_1937880 [compost metagenome]
MSAAKRIKGRFNGFFAYAATFDRKSAQFVYEPAQYRNFEQLGLGHILDLTVQLNPDRHRIEQADMVRAEQHPALLWHIFFPHNLQREQDGINQAKQSTANNINHE